ncbi:hypothetical protein [Alicyclobacillus sendaiensis]|uniref:Uncharacterized protein n=1 Tax=Alicyclobacillus sendaiensis PA2 TaxID=3029425 RepID=A0ABT6XX43_ALISE|nr:hypothetical protein [Alicyclobacillus sendaiensis]MDI9259661.1 hypothetical protein [Alicyclobacillus sendaiensis PA2]
MNRMRTLIITGFCSAVAAALLGYYVVIPAWTRHSDATRFQAAEQVWAETHAKSLRGADIVVARIGSYTVTGEDAYLFYVSTRQTQDGMESALHAPNETSFQESCSGLLQSLAMMVGAAKASHIAIPSDLSGYIREQLAPFSEIRPSSWPVAVMKARATHLQWESEVDWVPSFVAEQLAKRSPKALQNINKLPDAYRPPIEWVTPPEKVLSLMSPR